METPVATLLLLTATVVIACVVVDYAVNTMEQTLKTNNIPQLNQLKNLTNNLLNQTENLSNQTQSSLTSQPSPTP